jgi:hypothetical protein
MEQLQSRIDETRTGLGDTLEALTAQFDVKPRAGRRLRTVRERMPVLPLAAGFAVSALAGAFVWHRRHR